MCAYTHFHSATYKTRIYTVVRGIHEFLFVYHQSIKENSEVKKKEEKVVIIIIRFAFVRIIRFGIII